MGRFKKRGNTVMIELPRDIMNSPDVVGMLGGVSREQTRVGYLALGWEAHEGCHWYTKRE